MLMLMLAGLGPRSVRRTGEARRRQHPAPPCELMGLTRQVADDREKPPPPQMAELTRSRDRGAGGVGLGDVFFTKKPPRSFRPLAENSCQLDLQRDASAAPSLNARILPGRGGFGGAASAPPPAPAFPSPPVD
ncbi:uncharacterized protein PHA67_010916 isoform 1-T1 [Liasis olivaceus]